MQKKLNLAAFAGIIYLVSFLPELIFETMHEFGEGGGSTKAFLLISYIVSAASAILFYYGFVVIGNKLENNLLLVASYIIILTTIFYYLYAWYTIDLIDIEEEVFGVSILLLYGFSGILFGLGLYRTREILGNLASTAGILEMIVGFFLVTIILFFLGLILSIPAIIIEILLLLKVSQLESFKEA